MKREPRSPTSEAREADQPDPTTLPVQGQTFSGNETSRRAPPVASDVLSGAAQFAVVQGDCEAAIRALPNESVDAIVTDPPAGIGFMGKEWDSDKGGRDRWVAWLAGVMREALRALKPGGHALVWALPRTSHWTATALEDAGFEIRDYHLHLFGTGFPKSLDVAKAIDKQRDDREAVLRVTRWIAEIRDQAGLTNAEIDAHFGTNGMAGHWTSQASQPAVPTPEQWAQLCELFDVWNPELDAEVARLNARKGEPSDDYKDAPVVGMLKSPGKNPVVTSILAGAKDLTIRERVRDEAKRWVGWGTALKPAAEFWILGRKPLEGTVAENVQAWGTGALNIDGCRIPMSPEDAERIKNMGGFGKADWEGYSDGTRERWTTDFLGGTKGADSHAHELGRWPAHLSLDETTATLLDAQSGVTTSSDRVRHNTGAPSFAKGREYPRDSGGYSDSGGASRFFYVAKPTRAERDAGCEHLPERTAGETTDRAEGSAGLNNPRAGAGRGGGARNFHPTVKPINLMRWLVRLITPPGGVVLDLFTGSGTTGVGAVLEGMRFVGFEQSPEFVEIARARIAAATAEGPEPVELPQRPPGRPRPVQLQLFEGGSRG